MMSNALSMITGHFALLAAAIRGPGAYASHLAAVGCCVLAAWLVVRIARPGKLHLHRAPGRPNRIDFTLLLLLFIGWFALGMAGQGLAGWLVEATPPLRSASAPASAATPEMDPRLTALAGLIGYPLQLLFCLGVARWAFRGGLTRGLGLSFRRWPNDLVRALIALLAVWPVCMGLHALMIYLMPSLAGQTHPLLNFITTASPLWKILTFLATALLAPLSEEVFFRGILQSTLRRVTVSPWLAITITSVLFGLVHVWAQPAAVPSLVILSMVLGYNYERTGRLLAPILLHAFFNAANLLAQLGA